MASRPKSKAVPRKPLPDYSIPRTHPPNFPTSASDRVESEYHPSDPSTLSSSRRAQDYRNSTATDSPQMSLQEYHRQHGGGQEVEYEASTDMIPQELEGSAPSTTIAPSSSPPTAYSDYSIQPSSPVIVVPPPELPQSYFIMDTDTGMAYYPTAQAHPISRPLSPPSVFASYDIMGVPVITSNNPADRAKDVIKQRYVQEFQAMTQVGERLLLRLVELDIERERRRFERFVWSDAGNEELMGFAEWLMRGEE